MRHHRHLAPAACAAAVALAWLVLSTMSPLRAGADTGSAFHADLGGEQQINCLYAPAGGGPDSPLLFCDRYKLEPEHVQGLGVTIDDYRVHTIPPQSSYSGGATGDNIGTTLAASQTWTAGPFRCHAAMGSATCYEGARGPGFVMGSTTFRTFLTLVGSTDPCVAAFSSASSSTTGNTTSYNREASVQAIICAGFGGDVKFKIDDGVKCALLAAAIGSKFARTGVFVDGSCSGAALATDPGYGTTAAVACSMLSDLLGTDPDLKVFAIGAGVSCSFGHALGSWIESVAEEHAAEGVFQRSQCLRFTKHGFPTGDTWSAVKCKPNDHGFATTSQPSGSTGSSPAAPMQCGLIDVSGRQYRLSALGVSCAFAKAIVTLRYVNGASALAGPYAGWTCAVDQILCTAPYPAKKLASACVPGSPGC